MKHWLRSLALLPLLLLAAPAVAAPTVTEFNIPTASSEPEDIVLGPDGKLWFTEHGSGVNKIGRVTPGNPPLIEEFPLPTGYTTPFNITVGPDGKIWATASNGAAAVVRIDPSNTADFLGHGGYGLPGAAAGIAAGPDGRMWLGSQGGTLARIDATTMNESAVSDFALSGYNIRNLAAGPDGNVWVTDFGGRVARVSSDGTVKDFNIPGDGAWDIVTGPDGNLWYTAPEGNNSKIGQITPAGAFGPQFDVTDAGDQLGITVGPDGALWFAQAVANDIGRMTLGGQFSEVKGLTAAARPEYIAAGPNKTLWFTEKDGNRIGRISGIGTANTPPPPPAADTVRPRVTEFSLSRKRFRLGGRGTRIRFTLSEDATVTIRFARRVNGHWRRVRRKLRFESTAGAHRRRFRGRFDRKHALRPGRYRMTLRARDAAGNVSAAHRARFRLLPRR
jgi:virginiamycin B lyase